MKSSESYSNNLCKISHWNISQNKVHRLQNGFKQSLKSIHTVGIERRKTVFRKAIWEEKNSWENKASLKQGKEYRFWIIRIERCICWSRGCQTLRRIQSYNLSTKKYRNPTSQPFKWLLQKKEKGI